MQFLKSFWLLFWAVMKNEDNSTLKILLGRKSSVKENNFPPSKQKGDYCHLQDLMK